MILPGNYNMLKHYLKSLRTVKQHSRKWHAIKRRFFGANDISSLLNCGFHDKDEVISNKITGKVEEPDQDALERMAKGNRYEDTVRQLCSLRISSKIEETGLAFHPTLHFITASPDGITLDSDGNKMLTEFKVRKSVSDRIDFKYFVQMQVQMEVWNIDKCLYCENVISELDAPSLIVNDGEIGSTGSIEEDGILYHWKLEDYRQTIVSRDRLWWNKILPEVQKAWNLIETGRSKCHVQTRRQHKIRGTKRRLDDIEELDIRMNFLERKVRLPRNVNNTVLNDQLLDWLKFHSNASHGRDAPRGKYDFVSYIYDQTVKFRQVCQNYIKTIHPRLTVDVEDRFKPDEQKYSIKFDFNYKNWDRIEETQRLMLSNTPIIMNGGFYNEELGLYCKADMLVHKSHLDRFLPGSLVNSINHPKYSLFMIKFSTLNLRANGINLLSNQKQNIYKAHLAFMSLCLPLPQIETTRCYIIGRKSQQRKIKYTGAFDKIGVVDFDTVDLNYRTIINDALNWLNMVEKNGADWDVDNPCRPELYPNMKNKRDYPWHNFKKQLAQKVDEITQMYYMGPNKRVVAQNRGIASWKDLTTSDIDMKAGITLDRITNIIKANTQQTRVDIDLIDFHTLGKIPKIEFFIDFESVNGVDDDFTQFPESVSNSMIYMIGCVMLNNETGKMSYSSYIVDRLTPESERDMLNKWLSDMDNTVPDGKYYCYHWSNAEKWMLERAFRKHDCYGGNLLLIDLCREFQNSKCGISGAFGYGLKDIASALYREGLISTTWKDDLDGSQAMVAAWKAEEFCKKTGKIFNDIPFMTDLVEYNRVDCKVLQEILSYLRDKKSCK